MKLFALILIALIVTVLLGVGVFTSIASGMWPCSIAIMLGGWYMQGELFRAIGRTLER